MDFQRDPHTFEVTGVNLSAPVDRLPAGKVRIGRNIRPYGSGQVQGRQGTSLVSTFIQPGIPSTPINSLFVWDDPIPDPTQFPGSFATRVRLAGIGTQVIASRQPPGLCTSYQGSLFNLSSGFSGNPLSYVVANNDLTPRPWVYIGDSSQIRKVSSNLLGWPWGIAPPNFAPTIAYGANNANGPDIGNSPNGYIYAIRGRSEPITNTGGWSNLGPAVRMVNALVPSSTPGASHAPANIVITIPQAHMDRQVRWFDVFRWGGSLPVWKYIGSCDNIAGNTVTDPFPDSAIANAEEADLDDNPPFVSLSISVSGNCTVVPQGTGLGAQVIITSAGITIPSYSAAGPAPYYPAGTPVSIGGLNFTLYASPAAPTIFEVLEDPPVATTYNSEFTFNSPEVVHQPVPCVWGPFGGGVTGIFVFACGDPGRPGSIYWTKGNHVESHPGANVLDITSASEKLMNGCIYNGTSYVFSIKRMFAMYPTLGQISDFSALEVPNSKGLFARWGICTTPQGIAFVGKDGIYLTTGGGAPVNLTDPDFYPFFPHEGDTESSFQTVDGTEGATLVLVLPDFTKPETFRLSYGDGFLYFDYMNVVGNMATLVYSFSDNGWFPDDYNPQITCRYYEDVQNDTDGLTWKKIVMGTTTGKVVEYGGGADVSGPVACQIRTGSKFGGDDRSRKLWGDVWLEATGNSQPILVTLGFDKYTNRTATQVIGTSSSENIETIDINGGLGQYARDIGLDLFWSQTGTVDNPLIPVIFKWQPSFLTRPELISLRKTDFDTGGYDGDKWWQGVIIDADTLGRTITLNIETDTGGVVTQLQINHTGRQAIPYSFRAPFFGHMARVGLANPGDFWRCYGLQWRWEPMPELATSWITQPTALDLQGYIYHRDAYFAMIANADVQWTITVDNLDYDYTVPNTFGLYDRPYIVLQPMKGRAVSKYKAISSCPFRVFKYDLEVRAKQWGSPGPFLSIKPFGDRSRDVGGGARI